MVKNSIKVYARLKREDSEKKISKYEISRRNDHEDLKFLLNRQADVAVNKCYKYRFRKVFDQTANQNEVFDNVAKPIINSVINGFNGTIFAYGQTGSGKTYAITGSPNEYDDRGILPRSIQQIFEHTNNASSLFNVYISYLEIYNEVGYDLLNPKHHPSSLEELPRVVLLEDGNGEGHLRNLSVLPVVNEQEAMRLLFLGDTNRTIAETPMNEYSSRSHCIFTIYINTKTDSCGKIRKSKLHLVDLAGSERIHKSNITGIALNEAKHINLSLHYLEQVILALNQTNRTHIPYRNSMMTYILRDSVSGNSLTAMLATLAITRRNLDETITTCKFAQRVACVSTEAIINEEIDPQQEILFLRNEVDELRKQLISLKGINTTEKLTLEQEEHCKAVVRKFIDASCDLPADLDTRQIKLCFKLLQDSIKAREGIQKTNLRNTESTTDLLNKYKNIIKQKDEEISTLTSLLEVKPEKLAKERHQTECTPQQIHFTHQSTLSSIEKEALEVFLIDSNNKKEILNIEENLNKKYQIARNVAATIEKCQSNIMDIRKKLDANMNSREVSNKLNAFLISQQNVYRESILQLQSLKNETDFLKQARGQAEIRLMKKFKQWLSPENGRREPEHVTCPESDVFNCLENCNEFIKELATKKSTGYYCAASDVWVDNKDNYFADAQTFLCNNQYELPHYKCFASQSCNEQIKFNQYEIPRKCSENDHVNSSIDPMNNYLLVNNADHMKENCCNFSNINRNNKPTENLLFNYITPKTNDYTCISNYQNLLNNSVRYEIGTNLNDNRTKNVIVPENFATCTSSEQEDQVSEVYFQETSTNETYTSMSKASDTPEFLEFMKTIPLTGDPEVDDEIFSFYRSKFNSK